MCRHWSPKPHEVGMTLISSVSGLLKVRESVMKALAARLRGWRAAPTTTGQLALAAVRSAAL